MTDRDRIVQLARQQIDKPYQHKAHGPNRFDCLGLGLWIVRQLGYRVPPIDDYSRVPSGRRMRLALQQYLIEIRPSQALPGDFLHMAWSLQPQHLAIVSQVEPLRIIHADNTIGFVCQHAVTGKWREKIRGAYKLPERLSWLN